MSIANWKKVFKKVRVFAFKKQKEGTPQ